MKIFICSALGIVLSILSIGTVRPQSPAGNPVEASLRPFLSQFEAGINGFINGDPTLWKQNAARRDDVTLMGGWGAYKKGWNDVESQYDWAVARFRESGAKANVEYLSSGVSGDLAYTVTIERSEVRLVSQEKTAPMALRVTHIFRKEGGPGSSCIATPTRSSAGRSRPRSCGRATIKRSARYRKADFEVTTSMPTPSTTNPTEGINPTSPTAEP